MTPQPPRPLSDPQTAAGRALMRHGLLNRDNPAAREADAAAIAAVEQQARAAAIAECVAAVDEALSVKWTGCVGDCHMASRAEALAALERIGGAS